VHALHPAACLTFHSLSGHRPVLPILDLCTCVFVGPLLVGFGHAYSAAEKQYRTLVVRWPVLSILSANECVHIFQPCSYLPSLEPVWSSYDFPQRPERRQSGYVLSRIESLPMLLSPSFSRASACLPSWAIFIAELSYTRPFDPLLSCRRLRSETFRKCGRVQVLIPSHFDLEVQSSALNLELLGKESIREEFSDKLRGQWWSLGDLCCLLIDHLINFHATRDLTGQNSFRITIRRNKRLLRGTEAMGSISYKIHQHLTTFISHTTNPPARTLRVTGLGSGTGKRKHNRQRSKIKQR
jgi:hypothetical protein